MTSIISEVTSIATLGSIAIITGAFLQTHEFIRAFNGILPTFTLFLIAGLSFLLVSGIYLFQATFHIKRNKWIFEKIKEVFALLGTIMYLWAVIQSIVSFLIV